MMRLLCMAMCTMALAVGCTSGAPVGALCKNIPPGGCPLAHGQACDDPSCAAAYACNPEDGTWTLDHTCDHPAPDAAADAAPDDASPPADASTIDAPPGASGGPGCAPLEAPDCPLATALACPSGCCGCEDLFVCNQGWTLWGSCGDGGVTPRAVRGATLSSP